jgi:hypothetical protein
LREDLGAPYLIFSLPMHEQRRCVRRVSHTCPLVLNQTVQISSPADPALLLFKLNKLQQSQANSAANSMSSSPQPPHLTPPPGLLPPRFQNRHIQSMSLAPQPSFQPPMQYNPSAAFNPFGPNAVLGSDQIFDPTPADNIYAPQGRVPVTLSSLSAPDLSSRSRPSSRDSRPDFTRGFGLDIPEVDEVEEAPEEIPPETSAFVNAEVAGEGDESLVEDQGTTTVGQSRHHSRHVSRLSAALSLRSVGGRLSDPPLDDAQDMDIAFRGEIGNVGADEDAVEEWTGSEDLRVDSEFSEDEVCTPEYIRSFESQCLVGRASENGLTPPMRSELAKDAVSVECFVVQRTRLKSRGDFRTSHVLQATILPKLSLDRMICSRTPVRTI